jgi:hypothetical protein
MGLRGYGFVFGPDETLQIVFGAYPELLATICDIRYLANNILGLVAHDNVIPLPFIFVINQIDVLNRRSLCLCHFRERE